MTETSQPAGFDARPPVPVTEYEETVRRVNVGYELLFTLTTCFLRALRRPGLELLVVGAGGGAEIEQFLPGNPRWRLTGVDPSHDMLALAQAKADGLSVSERVSLIPGTVNDLPADGRFDAATCLFVLHFLSDDAKLALLREINARLSPDAPLLVATVVRPDEGGLVDDFLGAWQQYGELRGMPAERMASTIERLKDQPGQMAADDYVRLLREAGFKRVMCFFSALGGMVGWIAR